MRQPGCSTGAAGNAGLATPETPSTPLVAHGTAATPPVVVDPTLVNSCLALPDLRMKKKDRKRKGAVKINHFLTSKVESILHLSSVRTN